MKKLLLILILCSITSFAYAEKYYVFIDKVGKVEKGEEAGQNELGDVVGIFPKTKQYKPTRAEKDRYKIVVLDLTETQRINLIEPEGYIEKDEEGEDVFITTKARKRKINLNNAFVKQLKQEKEITSVQKSLFINAVIDKSR